MAGKKRTDTTDGAWFNDVNAERLASTMLELANRGPDQESLMLQVANAANIAPVSKTIKQRRMNRAKFAKVPKQTAGPAQRRTGKRSSRKTAANGAEHQPPAEG